MIYAKKFITRVGSLFLLVLLAGCQRDARPGQAFFASSCGDNPYLMKYHCSIERIQQEAEKGSADAQYALGYMYYYGISTVRDEETAGLWIRRSALQGQPLAKQALSLIQSNASQQSLPPSDAPKMNSQIPSEPITQHLPAYQNTETRTKHPVLNVLTDPRLSSDAKPIAEAPLHQQSTHEKGKYTIQLMASNNRKTLINFIHQHRIVATKTHIYRTHRHDHHWYMLTYGSYSTEVFALSALRELPSSVKRNHPWVKPIATIKREIKEQKVFS